MAALSTTDMKLIDSIFGIYSGYVLDFSNSTFDAFFRRDVGVDVYDAAYATYGDSKGKRFRAFLENARAAAVVKALTELWTYREVDRLDRGEMETIPNARARLSELIVKLGGKPLPGNPAEATQAAAPTRHTLRPGGRRGRSGVNPAGGPGRTQRCHSSTSPRSRMAPVEVHRPDGLNSARSGRSCPASDRS